MEIIKKNWKIKILSFIIAIFLWSFIIGAENPTISSKISGVPIIYENTEKINSKNFTIVGETKNYIDLTITGKRNAIINITPKHIRVVADLSRITEGIQKLPISIETPNGIGLQNPPKTIDINVEKVISKDFDITIKNQGVLSDNLVVEDTNITPSKVTLVGARSVIEKVDKVIASLDLSKIKDSITTNEKIVAVDSLGNEVTNIKYGQEFVNISSVINVKKEVDINLKTTGKISKEYKLISSKLNRTKVAIKGPKEVIEKIDSIDTQDINIAELTKNETVKVAFKLPSDVSLVNPELQYVVDFEIESKTTKTIEYPVTKISVNGLNSSFNISYLQDKTKIVLKGFSEEINKVTEDSIGVKLDLSNYEDGEYVVTPVINTNNKNVEKISAENVKIKLNIK